MAKYAQREPASGLQKMHCKMHSQARRSNRNNLTRVGHRVLVVACTLMLQHSVLSIGNVAEAVSVQRLQVPDLLVIDQQQRPPLPARFGQVPYQAATSPPARLQNGPEAASLINSQGPSPGPVAPDSVSTQQQQVVTFECLISFDRKRDRNLIVKWHHDERSEPIYQWIPELNKRTVSPQYRAYIAPILPTRADLGPGQPNLTNSNLSTSAISTSTGNATNQFQLLEAGFRLVRPTKELAGRYTCSAISSQNDDSKSKKMIVYTPPKSFRFNASRTDVGALLASQRDRLIQLTQPATGAGGGLSSQLPLAYRTRGLDSHQQLAGTTISPQMYSTIDYVNVNHQRPVGARASWPSPLPASVAGGSHPYQHQVMAAGTTTTTTTMTRKPRFGIKLVCDIDQVFPVPEVSIYRLARLEGAQAERLAKLDTRIERDPYTGLFRVQVTSILDDDELANIRQNYLSAPSSSSSSPSFASSAELEIQFECVIALTNLELSKYADNKRSIIYRPGHQLAAGQWDGSSASMNLASRTTQLAFGSSAGQQLTPLALRLLLLLPCALSLALAGPRSLVLAH